MSINQQFLLVIGGSDPSGGAGVQLDLKVGSSCGVHVATVITAVTAQNTEKFFTYQATAAALIGAQVEAIDTDFDIAAVKVGMLGSEEACFVVAEALEKILARKQVPIVLDPILSSTTGAELYPHAKVSTLCAQLFPLASIITPNIPELALFTDSPEDCLRQDPQFLRQVSKDLLVRTSSSALLVKGGHSAGDEVIDLLVEKSASGNVAAVNIREFRHPKLCQKNGAPLLVRGTGCFLSTLIAIFMMQGYLLAEAISSSIQALEHAMRDSRNIGHGEQNIFTLKRKLG